jgi:streptogramin lyase
LVLLFNYAQSQTWKNYPVTYSQLAVAVDCTGSTWFGKYSFGVLKFNTDNTTTQYDAFLTPINSNFITSIYFDNTGNGWFGGSPGSISKFENNTWTSYAYSDVY